MLQRRRSRGRAARVVGLVLGLLALVGGVAAAWVMYGDELVALLDDREPEDESGSESGTDAPRPTVDEDGELAVVGHVERSVVPGEATTITLGKGVEVELPVGAVVVPTTGSLRELRLPAAPPHPVRIFDVSLADGTLAKAARMTVPLTDPAEVASADDVDVWHRPDGGPWERLAAELVDGGKAVTFELEHLSAVTVAEPSSWSDYFKKVKAERRRGGPLPVPYYSQSSYGWCWAASAAMIEGQHGIGARPWEIAARQKVGRDSGVSFASTMAAELGSRYPKWETEHFGSWFSEDALDGYIAFQIDQGRPVWIGLPYAGHAVVVVGYDADNVYVHDPSGQLIEYARSKAIADTASGKNELTRYELSRKAWREVARGNPLEAGTTNWWAPAWFSANHTLVIKKPAAAGRTLSLQLQPRDLKGARGTFRAAHSRVSIGGSGVAHIDFEWEGTVDRGFLLRHRELDDERQAHLCNSDRLTALSVWVSNAGTAPVKVSARALLDGTEIGKDEREIAPGSNHEGVIKSSSGSSLLPSPLALEPHELRFELVAGGAVVDVAKLEFFVVPGLVQGVAAWRRGDEVEVRWDPSPEAKLPGTKIVYDVYRAAKSASHTGRIAGREHLARVDGATSWRLDSEQDGEDDDTYVYAVWATDLISATHGIDAVFREVELEDDYLPLRPGTRLEYEYASSMMSTLAARAKTKVAFTQTEILAVNRPGELVVTNTGEIVAGPTTSTVETVITRKFDKQPDRVVMGNAEIRSKMKVRTGKRTMTGTQKLRETVSSGHMEFYTAASKLQPGLTWSWSYVIDTKQLSKSGLFDPSPKQVGLQRIPKPGRQTVTATAKVLAREQLTVPAGRYDDCVKLQIDFKESRITQWYAPNVGLIREEVVPTGALARATGGGGMSKVLVKAVLPPPP